MRLSDHYYKDSSLSIVWSDYSDIDLILTRMHSSGMRTTRSLTVCHACPLSHHACPPLPHTPATHAPPCTPPAMHAPCHTCPPAMHAPWHACPPATHTPCQAMPPCHACPHHTCPHACPPATHGPTTMHAPLPCMPPYHACPPWTEFLTHASENFTLPQLCCGR